jgi:hypothetical protein
VNVLPYSNKTLAEVLSNDYTPESVIQKKYHFKYFDKYLGPNGLNAKIIVIEDDYISKDFLHDYASYYAFCFEKYPKFCKRIHFFSKDFSEQEFETVIRTQKKENKDFWKSYLGFIVVKPIPVTIIGYSVLKTYNSDNCTCLRNFWGIRNYTVHLYGNKISINSLAFQEQDSVLAACATTAIWSMLNKASIDFHTVLKSPSQITKDADNISPDGSRLFPNKGLNLLQICQAIYRSGLVSEVKQPDIVTNPDDKRIEKYISNLYLKKILNAYAPLGIPVILVIQVPNNGTYGLHAITVSGFHKESNIDYPLQDEISWIANNINKLYAHDDQWGPFVRIELKNELELISPWTDIDPQNIPTSVANIIVPVYPKVRISYEDIEVIVLGLDRILKFFFDKKIKTNIAWNIEIEYSENYKNKLKTSGLTKVELMQRLTQSMPKYIWIASCYIANHKIMEFTFDATDVNNGMIGEDIVCYLNNDIHQIMTEYLEKNKHILNSLFRHRASVNYYEFLLKKLHPSQNHSD